MLDLRPILFKGSWRPEYQEYLRQQAAAEGKGSPYADLQLALG